MHLIYRLLIIAIVFSSFGCKGEGDEPREENNIKTVLILGNSIVKHGPNPDIGWYGNWGMAASAEDSDFVHLLIRDIHQIDPSVKVSYKGIADFERDFDTYTLSNLSSFRSHDMLIMKISENVNDEKAFNDDFGLYYGKLVDYLDPYQKSIKIIVDGFWGKKYVNKMIEDYAKEKKYPFVSIHDLSLDSSNKATGLFENAGVAAHPSDKGMRMIEQRIWEKIKSYFGEQ
jgi:hypothetical protein